MASSLTGQRRENPPLESLYARRWLIFAAAMIGQLLAYLDATIVSISIPALQAAFHARVTNVAWVINAYNIAFAVPLVAMGRLADQFGRRRLLLIGLATFGVGSLACALAPTIGALIAARVLQGIGASTLVPLALATTTMVFPPERRGLGITLQALVGNVGAVSGPLIGGLLLHYASWHWIFAINVPICIGGLVFAAAVVPETYDLQAGKRIDAWGMALLAGSILALSYALAEGQTRGWGSPEIVGLFVAAALLAVAFGVSQRVGRAPMLNRALAANRQFMATCGAFVLFTLGFMGTFFLLVVALVELWGYSPIRAALATLVLPAGATVVAPLVTRFTARTAPRVLILPAVLMTAGALFWLSSFPATPDYLSILPALALAGAGLGIMFPVGFVAGMGTIGGDQLGLGSGILNMFRQIGVAIGVAIVASVFTAALTSRLVQDRARVVAIAQAARYPPSATRILVARITFDPRGGPRRRVTPRTPVERAAVAIVRGSAADSFGIAFRVAGLGVLLAAPFIFFLRDSPTRAVEGVELGL